MSDFYSILRRSILDRGIADGSERQAIYSQARRAMIRRLWSFEPPLDENEIERRIVAFDMAVGDIEADVVEAFAAGEDSAAEHGVAADAYDVDPYAADHAEADRRQPAYREAAHAEAEHAAYGEHDEYGEADAYRESDDHDPHYVETEYRGTGYAEPEDYPVAPPRRVPALADPSVYAEQVREAGLVRYHEEARRLDRERQALRPAEPPEDDYAEPVDGYDAARTAAHDDKYYDEPYYDDQDAVADAYDPPPAKARPQDRRRHLPLPVPVARRAPEPDPDYRPEPPGPPRRQRRDDDRSPESRSAARDVLPQRQPPAVAQRRSSEEDDDDLPRRRQRKRSAPRRPLSDRDKIFMLLGAIGVCVLLLGGIGIYVLMPRDSGVTVDIDAQHEVSDAATATRLASQAMPISQTFTLFDGRDPTVFETSPDNPIRFDAASGTVRISSSANSPGVRALIGPGLAARLAGHDVRVTIVARSSKDSGAASMRFAYQSGVAISHWQTANLGPDFQAVALTWRVPTLQTDKAGDLLVIQPGVPGDGTGADIQSIKIDLLSN